MVLMTVKGDRWPKELHSEQFVLAQKSRHEKTESRLHKCDFQQNSSPPLSRAGQPRQAGSSPGFPL